MEEGLQLRLWFDTDKGGTQGLRQKAVKRTGYPSTVFKPAEIIKTFGEVPDDLSEL